MILNHINVELLTMEFVTLAGKFLHPHFALIDNKFDGNNKSEWQNPPSSSLKWKPDFDNLKIKKKKKHLLRYLKVIRLQSSRGRFNGHL